MKSDPNLQYLTDPVWRLNNLYCVKDPDGDVVPFRPSPEQQDIIHAIYVEGLTKIVILKARQLGMSTVIELILFDFLVWQSGIQAAIVDATQTDASKKLENKIKLAWENLPSDVKSGFEIGKDSEKKFQIKLKNTNKGWNEVQAGMNARGDTFQFLHISEWGAIQFEDEQRSVEIATGALPAAKSGRVVIETTWKGGKAGPLWEIVHRSMTTDEKDMTDADYTLFFFPWYTDQRYHLDGNTSQIDPATNKYLDDLEAKEGITLLPSQRLWYFKEAMKLGFYRFREFPSTLDECFKGLIEGAVYQDLVMRAQAEGRVVDFNHNETNLVHTVWDLGSRQNTVTWFFQICGREIHFIDIICENDMSLTERVANILARGYSLGRHFLPHDARQEERAGKSFAAVIKEKGLESIVILPKPNDIWPGINHAQEMFSRFWFNKTNCERGVEALSCYHTKKDKKNDYQTETPVHDWSSHICDPVRLLAEADAAHVFSRQDQGVVNLHKRRPKRQRLAKR